MAAKRRRNILSAVKGYRFARSKKKRAAIEAIHHAHLHAFAHRRDKKNDFRQLWIARLNAAIRSHGIRYSAFIAALKRKGVEIDRKILATLAKDRPETFDRIVAQMK